MSNLKSEEENLLSFKDLSFKKKILAIITGILCLPIIFIVVLSFLYSVKGFRGRLDFIFGCLMLLFLLIILFMSQYTPIPEVLFKQQK